MNIGMVVPGFSADYSDWCIPALRNLVEKLATREDLRVFALRYPYRAGRYELFGARVTAVGGGIRQGLGSAALWARGLSLLLAAHRRRPFDLLHAFWAGETGALTAVTGALLRVPVVVSLAGGELASIPGIAYGGQLARTERLKTRFALSRACRVTTGSRHLLSLAAQHAGRPSSRLSRVPLGVDTELFRSDPTIGATSPPRLVQVASLVPVKDQTTLLSAAALLRDWNHDFRLEIAGSGPLELTLRSFIARFDLEDRVALRGAIPHDQLPAFYAGATAYVQSSLHEAQGMALLEAAACGVPSVGTRVGTLPELEPDAAVGCDAGDPAQLAAAVATLLEDRSRGAAMAAAGRAMAEEEYSLKRCVERFRGLYAQLV